MPNSSLSASEDEIRRLNFLFIGPRLHPNYSDFLRELGSEASVKVVVSRFFQNDDFEGLDFRAFPASLFNSLRRRFFRTEEALETFLFRRNCPSFTWIIYYLIKNRIHTVIARSENKAFYRKVRIASFILSVKMFTFRQGILQNDTKTDRYSLWPLKKGDLDEQRCHNYVPLGISIPRCKSGKVRPGRIDSGTLRLVSVGKFVERKGHRLVVDAVDLIKDQLSIKIDIFGSYGGPSAEYRDALQEEIYLRGLDEFIELMPAVARSAMIRNYEKYDAYLFAGWSNAKAQSFAETYERANGTNGTLLFSMLEAMSVGLPVICSSDKKVVGSVENDVNGLVFESGNASDLARKIRSLTNLGLREMGEHSLRIALEHHNVKNVHASFARLVSR